MDAERFRKRRDRLLESIAGGLLLVRGAGAGGVNPNFLYLTGIAEPRGALLMAPEGIRVGTGRGHPGPDYVSGRIVRQVLLLPRADPLAAAWGEDATATMESVSAEQAKVEEVLPSASLESLLTAALARLPSLHFVRSAAASLSGADGPDVEFFDRVRRRLLGVDLHDATPLVEAMRCRKDAGEVRAIERAAAVTDEAMRAVMRAARAGVREFELEAEIARVYRTHGGTNAFDPIVGAGPNALKLHYTANSGTLADGDLVLVDSGASLGGYKADVTRTFPVDGKFSARQRELYDVVLAAQLETIEACRPGVRLGELHRVAWEAIERSGLGEWFIHGTSHHLGLETHDVGDVHAPLEPGAVITVEPGLYLAEEQIGIRIEDDVLITEDGCRVLTASIPKTPDDLEREMADGH